MGIVIHLSFIFNMCTLMYVSISHAFLNVCRHLPGVCCSALWLLIFAVFLKGLLVSSMLAGALGNWYVEEQSW